MIFDTSYMYIHRARHRKAVRNYDIKVITQLLSYWPHIEPSVDNSPRLRLGQLSTLGLDIRADIQTVV